VSNEGLLRPRIARAQETIRLHPLRCSNHLLRGVAEAALHCAHRTSTFLSCAFCEQERWPGCSPPRPSEAARCTRDNSSPASSEAAGVVSIARIERPPLYRGGSASTETTPAVSPPPPSSLVLSQGWGLINLPLRASNEGLRRPRVARAQKIIGPHPPSVPRAQGSTRLPPGPWASGAD
jgi:hypothetical protein